MRTLLVRTRLTYFLQNAYSFRTNCIGTVLSIRLIRALWLVCQSKPVYSYYFLAVQCSKNKPM